MTPYAENRLHWIVRELMQIREEMEELKQIKNLLGLLNLILVLVACFGWGLFRR